ncbi:hypoxia-inducible factor 1-alpha inhibitor-like [Ruditapes philippinarum]|uniref:hypoxia-inducible factor 1-alpha inhibitor-like n=1 Tax=Ruditapes philippinarum TaxID=129788 RepID=UPI00295B3F63|nr:hypoxia-inducible factor 1-alpha inhibitor-like [Ruditapes philippinarum]
MATEENQSESRLSSATSYAFPLKDIPRLSCNDRKALEMIRKSEPVILTDTNLVASALHWSLDYLADHIGDGNFTVYKSDSHKFKYYSDKKCKMVKEFRPPTVQMEMKFKDFAALLKRKQKERDCSEKIYLQQALNDSVEKTIVYDFVNFNWAWLTEQQTLNNWGPLTSNLLLVGMEGNVTPVHYDEQENFFAQIYGHKRFKLFHPDQYKNLYPYPVYHPHDRQSQVNLDCPDFDKFPNARNLTGYQGIVGPGDVLYIPMYWWHEVESLKDKGETISVNFWYMSRSVDKVEHPLSAQQKMAMTRNIEKMILQALDDPEEVPSFMQMLVLGRYT